jgi:hypothetical protein
MAMDVCFSMVGYAKNSKPPTQLADLGMDFYSVFQMAQDSCCDLFSARFYGQPCKSKLGVCFGSGFPAKSTQTLKYNAN